MNNKPIVFARPRHNYGSYADLWRLIALAGLPTQFIDEVDWSAEQTVIALVKNWEWTCIPPRHNARLIWWCIERCGNTSDPMDMANPHVPPCVDEVWTSDRSIATRHGWKYVFLGSHPDFSRVALPIHRVKHYDVITLMAPLPRRAQLMNDLRRFKLADTGNLWGEERHQRLEDSRLMIMCHQDDQPICEPPRMMIGGSYALPMLCEESEDSGYWIEGVHYHGTKLAYLANVASIILKDGAWLANLGMAAWRLVTIEHPFRQEVEAAL